ncbi:hypothetical protein [Prauserella alba]|uniref:Uncharacterized protein n=1 Tax=Prauserella alba TaxID=176898 RepID=A0ABN1VLY0_9PSEU|nr:hypothetical protein [Prauserella alba]MCP2180884.1 hypothetical protein [Prauserella alba]
MVARLSRRRGGGRSIQDSEKDRQEFAAAQAMLCSMSKEDLMAFTSLGSMAGPDEAVRTANQLGALGSSDAGRAATTSARFLPQRRPFVP